jgi:hypothetical protein
MQNINPILYLIFLFTFTILITDSKSAEDDFYFHNNQFFSRNNGVTRDHKCGFPTVIRAHEPGNEKILQKLENWRTKSFELDSIYYSPSGHFKIHYTKSGFSAIPDYDRNQNGTADYLEFVAHSFDRAWDVEINALGFKPPPDSSGNPRQVYPIFCKPLSVYGSTNLLYEIESIEGLNYVTEIEINTDYSYAFYEDAKDDIARDSMAIAVTAAHEFNHALQSGYRLWENESGTAFEDLWFIESSAVYMEEVVTPEVNDYLEYLPSYFRKIAVPFDNSDGSTADYGKVVFELLLGQRYGLDITQKIWQQITKERAMPAVETVLEEFGSNVLSELSLLSAWLYFTNSLAVPGQYFNDADLFPPLSITETPPIYEPYIEILNDSLPRYSFNWFKAEILLEQTRSYLLRDLDNNFTGGLQVVFIDPVQGFHILPAGIAFDFPANREPRSLFYSIVAGKGENDNLANFKMLTRIQGVWGRNDIFVYPQPLNISNTQPSITFANIPDDTKIYIYNSNAKHLQTLESAVNLNYIVWDLTTKYNEPLVTGIYLYRVVSENLSQTGKFVIIQ